MQIVSNEKTELSSLAQHKTNAPNKNKLGGRKLEDLKMSRLENAIQIQVSDFSSGIYFIKATDEKGFVHTAKFVKE